MARRPALDLDEAPPLTAEQLAELRPAREVHTPQEFAALTAVRRRGRPVAADPKVPVTIRLDASTVAAFKATGAGWQTRMNVILAAHLDDLVPDFTASAEAARVSVARTRRTAKRRTAA